MEKFEIIVPTIFGLEAFVSREIKALGYETSSVEDGRVTFWGDLTAVARANLWVRCGERILIKAGEFEARSFEDLFQGTKAIDWSQWLGKECAFPVTGFCLKSTLASMRDCQAIIKKAIVDSLSQKYNISFFEESGPTYQIRFSIMKDRVTLMIDTTGDGLHKRGYRAVSNAAPLKETIAAAMVLLSRWKYEYPFADPLCGSGTIPIEAAMIKRNIAPGLTRSFMSESFLQYDNDIWKNARTEAEDLKRDVPLNIYASDLDPSSVEIARKNAELAGVSDAVRPTVLNVSDFYTKDSYGTIVCNPPYGERLGDENLCRELYKTMGNSFKKLNKWSHFILTSNEEFENAFGKKADKKRKLYNGMLKCNIYQYFGERPPKIFNKDYSQRKEIHQ